ncbi:MAG: hypothetical protein ABSH12_07290 [Endomicrobiales bacterium]|jgi:hypothetical protein
MPIGQNAPVMDKLIKITVPAENITIKRAPLKSKTSITNNTSKTHKTSTSITSPTKTPAENNSPKKTATENTVKMTFYVKHDILNKLYNYAYWDRHTVTEAFNTVMVDGLKGKNTSQKK